MRIVLRAIAQPRSSGNPRTSTEEMISYGVSNAPKTMDALLYGLRNVCNGDRCPCRRNPHIFSATRRNPRAAMDNSRVRG